jgi:peptidoglycan hydrolase-like protein with peptidoglycan-binding domain
MKRKEIVSFLFVGATALVLTAAPTWAQSEGKKDSSVGGSQSERVGPGADTPLPKGSSQAGSTEGSKAGKGPGSSSAQGKDTAIGGSQSERAGSGADTSKGSRSAGSGDAGKAGKGASQSQAMGGQQDVRQVQEALKDKGHDPGPIDGVMGSQTKQALREFQKANGLKQTGTLDSQTKEKLNIEGSSSSSGASKGSSTGSMGRGESSKSQKEPSSSPMGK